MNDGAILLGYVVFVIALLWGGDAFARLVLRWAGRWPPPLGADAEAAAGNDERRARERAGSVIGILERALVAAGVILGEATVIAGVIALKGIARYQDLDRAEEAEYFLIGSLASLAYAGLLAVGLIAYDAEIGFAVFPGPAP